MTFNEWLDKYYSYRNRNYKNEILYAKSKYDETYLKEELLEMYEDTKQHLIDIMQEDEKLGLYEQTKCYCGHTTTCDCGPEEPKQETLLEDVFNEEKKKGVKDLINKYKQDNE